VLTKRFGFFSLCALACALAACASPSGGAAGVAGAIPQGATLPLGKYIKHVVIVVQENRSFDNLFAGYPGADAPMYGRLFKSPGPDATAPLHEITLEGDPGSGPPHGFSNAIWDWNKGRMDGFNTYTSVPTALYSYVSRKETKPYWDMAREWVLADHMFPTEFGPSFTAHLDLIAGTTDLTPTKTVIDVPYGADAFYGWGCAANKSARTAVATIADPHPSPSGNGPFPCFDQWRTMADTLDAAKLSWRYYAPVLSQNGGLWSAFQAIRNVYYGPDWKNNVVSPPSQFLVDTANGNLAAVTWVIPEAQDSDHPATHSNTGPSWVASVVNAVGQSKDWDSTAIFIVWDDWGGYYDNVAPPQPNVPFTGNGIRVGCLIVSPYAKHGYVSHTDYQFGSILHFIEDAFNLPPLGTLAQGYTDGTSTLPTDSFDFTQKPRTFVPIAAPYPPAYFRHEKPSGKAPDDD